jgi:hypothetical protein
MISRKWRWSGATDLALGGTGCKIAELRQSYFKISGLAIFSCCLADLAQDEPEPEPRAHRTTVAGHETPATKQCERCRDPCKQFRLDFSRSIAMSLRHQQ